MGYAYIDGNRTRVLLDGGSQINSITPAYAKSQGLEIGDLNDLAGDTAGRPFQGLGGARSGALGYVIFRVQLEGIAGYDEEQVALVIQDDSLFGRQIPIILGTPTLHRAMRTIKESEMENAPEVWKRVQLAYEVVNGIACCKATYDLESDETYPINTNTDPTDLDESVILTNKFTVPAFGTEIIKGRTKKTMMMGHKLRVMTQAPYPEDDANLPLGLYVLRTYTELKDGSRNVTLVVRNGTARPIHMNGGRIIGRVVAANLVPDPEPSPELLKKLQEEEEQSAPKLTVAERQKLLIEVLSKDGGLDALKAWPRKLQKKLRSY